MVRLCGWIVVCAWGISQIGAVSATETPAKSVARTPQELAKQIDQRLDLIIQAEEAILAPRSSDAEFLRRVTLDLIGRIPTVSEARAFLDDTNANKRTVLVKRLLDSPGYALQSAQVWGTFLIPQATTNLPKQYLGLGIEAWLRDRLRAGLRDDQIVRELLTAKLDYLDWTEDKKSKPAEGLSPVGYYQANDLKPETVAAAVGRNFLGLKLECAQCHDHPFDKWTRKQAWETAAFFAGVAPLEPEIQPALNLANRKILTITDTTIQVEAKFLDGAQPAWNKTPNPRQAFAEWLTRADNPFFAKVMVNRIWANLFGKGLVDPVEDWGVHNPPSHPELLEDLAKAYAASGFDPKFILEAITSSKAYQRTSRRSHPSQDEPRLLARMNVKGLTPEQLFDSLALATGYRDPIPVAGRSVEGWPARSPRGMFLAKFGGGSSRTDMQVSILQSLSLMNGEWLSRQTDPAQSEMLRSILQAPFLTDDQRLETLFLATLSRRPEASETERYKTHLKNADDSKKAFADVLWILLNSQEFLVNH